MELVDVANDGLLCGHGLVVHVGSREWPRCERDLVAVFVPGVGNDRQRANFWRTRQRSGPANVLLLYRRRRFDTVLRNAPGERAVCNLPWHTVRDDFRRSGVVHAKYQESRPRLVDRAESFRDSSAARSVGLA